MLFRNAAANVFAFEMLLSHAQQSRFCYTSNGGRIGNQTPCNPQDDVSSCCDTSDYCLNNKLCQVGPNSTDDGSFRYYASSCTTYDGYQTPCIDFCNAEVQDYVEKCPSQMYCCAENGPDCCSREDDPDIVFQLEEPSITATALIPSETDVSADGDATGKNPVVIGLGVGVPCSLMILGAAGFFLWRCRAKRREELSKKQPEIMPTQEEHGPHRQPEDAAPPYESTGAAEPIPAPPATVTQENQNGLLGNAKPMTAGVKEAVNAAGRVQDSRQHETTPNTVFEAPDNVVAPGNRFELG